MSRVWDLVGLPEGSQTFFLLLQNESVFPGACRGLGLGPLIPAGKAAGEPKLALEMGRGKALQGQTRGEGQREGESSLSFQRHLLVMC